MDLFERVNRETPITGLRWSIAHLNDGSAATFERMKALGVGWTMQDAMYFQGDQELARRGEAARRMPPIMTALRTGVHVGAGTDAHRVASYNPFVALQWMLDGKTVGGTALRGPDETPTREQALRLYTLGSAWFSFDDDKRGSLEVGKLADFAILDRDYFSVPAGEIARIESVMTVVGGKVVFISLSCAAPLRQNVTSQRRLPRSKAMGLVQSCSAMFRLGSIGAGLDVYMESVAMLPDFPYASGDSLLAHEAVMIVRTIAAPAAK